MRDALEQSRFVSPPFKTIMGAEAPHPPPVRRRLEKRTTWQHGKPLQQEDVTLRTTGDGSSFLSTADTLQTDDTENAAVALTSWLPSKYYSSPPGCGCAADPAPAAIIQLCKLAMLHPTAEVVLSLPDVPVHA